MVIHKKTLDEIRPFLPARSIESVKREYGVETVLKLAGNENNHGASPLVPEAIRNCLSEITRYPDTNATLLREALAKHLCAGEDELLFGNGSFELISIVSAAFLEEGAEVVIPQPSFGWYTVAAKTESAAPVFVPLKDYANDLDAMAAKITDRTRLVWLCNPNNPTGAYFNAKDLDRFLDKVPSSLLIALDEAYIDFSAPDSPRSEDLIHRHKNIVSLRTFSKVYALASLRIAYALADREVIALLSKIRQPINTNTVAQAAALAALSDEAHYRFVVDENEKGKRLYYRELARLGFSYIPTQCNFIMFDVQTSADEVAEAFLQRGILIRSGGEFGMPTWVRVTIGPESENRRVIQALEEIMLLKKR
ncbi:MAG: histidinol-phosphate transaminase [Spirochaetaceae bacterium]|jgi:histidinol-phosphate aminotransferase|nr:histidinol-phosphate transaminase [Spirochaetaceae bacterium]